LRLFASVEPNETQDRVALITGAAFGIGKATAELGGAGPPRQIRRRIERHRVSLRRSTISRYA
jgi:hypothetical protein